MKKVEHARRRFSKEFKQVAVKMMAEKGYSVTEVGNGPWNRLKPAVLL